MRRLPTGFSADIADALGQCPLDRTDRERSKEDWAQGGDRSSGFVEAGRKLQTAITRANAAWGLSPLPHGFSSDGKIWIMILALLGDRDQGK